MNIIWHADVMEVIGAVIGAKLARPEATCVALTGDGAFLMHGSEISTAKRYGVGAIWIVLGQLVGFLVCWVGWHVTKQ